MTLHLLLSLHSTRDTYFFSLLAHINTGRGLAIYRNQLKDLFKNYGFTHFYPMLYVLSGCVGYYLMSSDLGGGTLPLIMILVLVLAVLLTPQIVNPAIKGNSLSGTSTSHALSILLPPH